VQARLDHGAPLADLPGLINLEQRWTGVSDREEQLRVYVTAGGFVAPVHDVHSFWAFRPFFVVQVGPVNAASVLVNHFTSYAIFKDTYIPVSM
jgi:hypothetical protein